MSSLAGQSVRSGARWAELTQLHEVRSGPDDASPPASDPSAHNQHVRPNLITSYEGWSDGNRPRPSKTAELVALKLLPPIIFPGRPERWWGDEALKAETDAPQATLEQRHQAAGDVLALRCRGFFSA